MPQDDYTRGRAWPEDAAEGGVLLVEQALRLRARAADGLDSLAPPAGCCAGLRGAALRDHRMAALVRAALLGPEEDRCAGATLILAHRERGVRGGWVGQERRVDRWGVRAQIENASTRLRWRLLDRWKNCYDGHVAASLIELVAERHGFGVHARISASIPAPWLRFWSAAGRRLLVKHGLFATAVDPLGPGRWRVVLERRPSSSFDLDVVACVVVVGPRGGIHRLPDEPSCCERVAAENRPRALAAHGRGGAYKGVQGCGLASAYVAFWSGRDVFSAFMEGAGLVAYEVSAWRNPRICSLLLTLSSRSRRVKKARDAFDRGAAA